MSDNNVMAVIWDKELEPGQVYTIDVLIDVAVRSDPWFAGKSRQQMRTRFHEQTDTGEAKETQHSKQFVSIGRDKRLYLGIPLSEVERQAALHALERRERDAIAGRLPRTIRPKVRRALRGRRGENVRRKLKAQRGLCGICGSPIYPAHPDGAELDHIVSLGAEPPGPDTLENTRAAHRICNAVLGCTDDEPGTRTDRMAVGWPVDADAAEVATARAKGVR